MSISAVGGGAIRAEQIVGIARERAGGVSGIRYVVLILVSMFIAPVPPLSRLSRRASAPRRER